MRLPTLGIVTAVLIIALVASIWFWIAMFGRQTPSGTGEPLTNCAAFGEARESCEKSIAVATTTFSGTVLESKPLSHEEAKQKYGVLLNKWNTTVWEIKIELSPSIPFSKPQAQREESPINVRRIVVLTDPSAKIAFPVKYEVDTP
ncbi:MAG: hypothetical protein A2564_03630 [Candidatus Wildermuthbacteria bacterium RIFOXYD1_FULL_50_12]|nr:MAG: hypothetical protein A2564_03630 [Candidatus Wildermuthbacteria bacterium RIFOXYD1_FULL_50_12]